MPFRAFAAVLILLALAAGAPARAGGPVVVELYTSQGCSSCPPADALLTELSERDDVIALALHVDYWDYIGWADDFAQPAFTERQRRYAAAAGERTIYTPQMVIGGRHHVIGAHVMKIAHAIEAAAHAPQPVDVVLHRDGGRVRIDVQGGEGTPEDSALFLVTWDPEATRDIGRGENAGKRLVYSNIVRSWTRIGSVGPGATMALAEDVPADTPIAVIAQAPGAGPILGAAKLD